MNENEMKNDIQTREIKPRERGKDPKTRKPYRGSARMSADRKKSKAYH